MFLPSILSLRWALFFFLFVSFWPWEKEVGEVKKTSFEIPHDSNLLKVVRVALFYEKRQVSVSTSASYEMSGLPANQLLNKGSSLASTTIRPESSGIRVGSSLYSVTGLRITSQTKELQVEKKKYRNAIRVLKNPTGSLTVVNETDVEDYLKGVVPAEMNPTWPEEALKAQAVVSRTYAIFKNIENKDFPFTLSSDVGSQVYVGESLEHPGSSRAVERTRGEILTHRRKIFPTFFHSTCGGRTTRADYQWKIEPHPSLKGVECPFCRGSKFYGWKAEMAASEIQKLLAKKGYSIQGLESITPQEEDASGRPRFFVIRHGSGSLKLTANEFRLILGSDRIRSTRMKIENSGDKFLVRGRGWGHGVGLCQYGAKHLAELGYRYRDILRYYYPESEIQNLEDFVGPEDPRSRVSIGEKQGRAKETKAKEGNIFKRWYGNITSYIEDL